MRFVQHIGLRLGCTMVVNVMKQVTPIGALSQCVLAGKGNSYNPKSLCTLVMNYSKKDGFSL